MLHCFALRPFTGLVAPLHPQRPTGHAGNKGACPSHDHPSTTLVRQCEAEHPQQSQTFHSALLSCQCINSPFTAPDGWRLPSAACHLVWDHSMRSP